MVASIDHCPQCGARVAPRGDGICPACGAAWSDSTAALKPAPVDAAGAAIKLTPVMLAKAFELALAAVTPRVVVTPALVALNVAAYAIMVVAGVHFLNPTADDLWRWGGNYGPDTLHGQWWRLVTAMFIHAGALHLAFNMWALWDLGRLVERLVGNVGFAILYFATGIAASITSLAFHPNIVCIGASGAVFGVAGALLGILALRRDTVPPIVLHHLRNSMFVFLGYNVLYGLQAEGVDMAAHAGGFVAGFACGLALSQPLSANMAARRTPRNVALAAASLVLLPLAAMALPAPPPDHSAAWKEFAALERRVMARSNELAQQGDAGTLTEEQAADALERDVLLPWRTMQAKLANLNTAEDNNREVAARILDYMTVRGEAWQYQIEAWREHDDRKAELASERWAQADALAGEISSEP
jgi:rhomboid protease GluP